MPDILQRIQDAYARNPAEAFNLLPELIEATEAGIVTARDEKTLLAMSAGARAINNNKRLQGTIYVYDVFGSNPKELSYYEAAQILSTARAALEAQNGRD